MTKRQMMHILLIAVLWIGMLPVTAFPQPAIAESVAETADIIEVTNQAELAGMTGEGSYQLMNDIELSAWEPIGFTGTLDGNGHSIILNGKPLFDELHGVVRNVLLEGNVEETKNTGALAYTMTDGLIQNIWSGAAVKINGFGANGVGGLVGKMSGGLAQSIVVTGTLTPPPYSPVYGTAVIGKGAAFDHNYWTDKTTNVAQAPKKATNSGGLQDDTIAELNSLVSLTAGLRYWELEDGVPKPTGAVSTGEITDPVDKTSLITAISNAEKEQKAAYTEKSWNRFAEALENAQRIADETRVTELIVQKAAEELNQACNELISIYNYERLTEKVKEADGLPYDMYSSASWTNMVEVRKRAETLLGKLDSGKSADITDSDVGDSATALLDAMLALEDIRVPIKSAEELSEVDGAGYYILKADISEFKGNAHTLTGKLDGDGHLVTFANEAKPLFQSIAKNAEIRNVGLAGTISGGGAFAEIVSGKIFNSYSWADVDAGESPAGGVAGKAVSATIKNTYITGTVKGSAIGGLAGTGETAFGSVNNYWVTGKNEIGTAESDDKVSSQRTLEQMKTNDFIATFNKQRFEQYRIPGLPWNRNEAGLPYFGEEADAGEDDQTFYPVQSTNYFDGTIQTITRSKDPVTVSIFGKPNGDAARLELQDYTGKVKWKTASEQHNLPIIVASGSGEVWVRSAGTVTVDAIDVNTSEKIQSFTLKAEIPKEYALSLRVADTDYTGQSFIIQDNRNTDIVPFVQVGKEPAQQVNASLFNWKSSQPDVVNVDSTGYLSVKKTGSATITATLENVSKKVKVVAGYKGVESIKPTFAGTYYIHSRSPNSIGQNDTPGVASFSPLRQLDEAGKPIIGSEFAVAETVPSDATYAKDYTVTSTNNAVLTFKESMQNNLIPAKEGTVGLTVTSNDPRLASTVSGTSEVTIKYFNPLKSLTVKSDKLTVKEGQVIDAGLIFKGLDSKSDYHVTESNMNWTQEGTGEVRPYRSYPVIMLSDEAASLKEGVVSNDQWLIRGVKEGMVTLTGTPVDDQNGAEPVTLTIEVAEGGGAAETPAKEQVTEALKKTMDYQAAQIGTPEYGDEWTVFGLARAGYEAPADFYETYYASVFDKVVKEAAQKKNRFGNSVTDVQRLALALTAIGKDPQNVKGVNLLNYNWNKEANFPGITPDGILGHRQGSNELIFAMLAVEANDDFKQPADASITVQEMITRLIAEYQTADGGFGLSDNKTSSIDMTAMAIQALAKHQQHDATKVAVDKAIDKLSKMQGVDGSYGTSESTSQVIVALLELGIDPHTDTRFIKGGSSVLDGQMTYSKPDGSFAHSFGGAGNVIATDQAFYTLAALDRFYNNKNSLYNMNDVKIGNTGSTSVTSVSVSPSDSELEVGKNVQLKATVLPADAADTTVSWASDNEDVASVTTDGQVTGIAAGTAVITATATDGNRASSATITVVKPAPPTNPETKQKIQFSVEKRTTGNGDIIAPSTVIIEKGDTAFTVLKRIVDKKGVSIRYIGSGATLYVSAIDNLGEFDEGTGSGWMYSVNGVFPEYSAGLYALKEGDVLRWRYTKNLGADLGEQPPKPETPKPEAPPVVEKPEHVEAVIEDGFVKIEVKDEKTGESKPAKIETSESIGGFTIVQIGERGNVMMEGLKLPEGKQKVVIIDNDKPYEYFKSEIDQLPNKEWKISFSGALLDQPENLEKVVVKNAAGKVMDVSPVLSADGKTIAIDPASDYEKGELYYITIADMKSATGKVLSKPIRKVFTVK